MRDPAGCRFTVKVTPRAARTVLVALPEGDGATPVAQVRVTAPPAGGAANAAVVAVLASALGLGARELVLVAGASSRLKVFEVPIGLGEVRRRIAAAHLA